MKLLPLLGSLIYAFTKKEAKLTATRDAGNCLVCEYVNVAASEDAAIAALKGATGEPTEFVPCILPKIDPTSLRLDDGQSLDEIPGYSLEANKYCMATFFMSKSKELNNRVIYGVQRTVAESEIANGYRVYLDHYDGVKGYQLTGSAKGNNLMFSERSERGNQFFAMDGRDDFIDDGASDSTISRSSIQIQIWTRCIVCHGSQEFINNPRQAFDVTMPCWNPSISTTFLTDTQSSVDPKNYCIPSETGLCYTKTFQYGTKDTRGVTTSNWIVIRRGCVSKEDLATQNVNKGEILTGNTRSLTNAQMNVRFYHPTNSASKAKDNAKYPDNDVSTQTWFQKIGGGAKKSTDYDIRPLTVQFSSRDGYGKPDVPSYENNIFDELECLQCATSFGNTDNTHECVNAKTTGRVRCKTLSCSSISAAYKLGEYASENFYYNKRGCTADPDDGVPNGEQRIADRYVVPKGWTGISQRNQRSTTANGNTGRASIISTAKIFDCFSCESSFSEIVAGVNEPTYDSIKDKDDALCWQTFTPTRDSLTTASTTSGVCTGQCYASAYRYKLNVGSSKLPAAKWTWYVKRGCDNEELMIDGITAAEDVYGVDMETRVCDYSNGALCNGKVAAYDLTPEVGTQTAELLQCFQCETDPSNTNKQDKCYTGVSTAIAVNCPDLSYTSCVTIQSSYIYNKEAIYKMKRGCHKGEQVVEHDFVSGSTEVYLNTEYCSSQLCNKAAGDTRLDTQNVPNVSNVSSVTNIPNVTNATNVPDVTSTSNTTTFPNVLMPSDSSDDLTAPIVETETDSGASVAQFFFALNGILLATLF